MNAAGRNTEVHRSSNEARVNKQMVNRLMSRRKGTHIAGSPNEKVEL